MQAADPVSQQNVPGQSVRGQNVPGQNAPGENTLGQTPDPAGPTIAVVLKGYPRLSETFIAQELLALERRGFRLQLISLRHPTDSKRHPIHGEITAPVRYLPEYLYQELPRVWRGWRLAGRLAGYRLARRVFLKDLWRDRTPNRIRRFGQACVLAAELPQGVERLYAHFLHTPASVARYAAMMRGLPWCASAHAKDIWTLPDWEKREKLADLDWLVTCTAYGAEHLRSLAPAETGREPETGQKTERVGLVYHGLDLSRFAKPQDGPGDTTARDGSSPAAAVRLLSVGRLVEKKGYDDLLAALALLPPDLHWQLTHIGGGPLARKLEQQAEELGLTARISWLGPQAQEAVLAQYRSADLFILASRIARSGDRDGLPNVLMEAQSQGLTCLATAVAAIPELIEDGVSGTLVPPDDPAALGRALDRLIADPALRTRLGNAGEARIRRDFDMHRGIDALDRLLRSGKAHKSAESL